MRFFTVQGLIISFVIAAVLVTCVKLARGHEPLVTIQWELIRL